MHGRNAKISAGVFLAKCPRSYWIEKQLRRGRKSNYFDFRCLLIACKHFAISIFVLTIFLGLRATNILFLFNTYGPVRSGTFRLGRLMPVPLHRRACEKYTASCCSRNPTRKRDCSVLCVRNVTSSVSELRAPRNNANSCTKGTF